MTNIVYLMADDLGFADFNPTFMPRSYELFQSLGTELNFQTAAFCAPTRTALMTGIQPEKFGMTMSYAVQDFPGLPVEETLLSERFQDAGYATGLFGKWALGLEEEQAPWNQGFDHSIGFLHGQVFYFGLPDGPEIGIERYEDRAIGHSHHQGHDMLLNGTPIHSSQYSTFLFEDAAREWIRDRADLNEDFFAYVPFNAPHTPYSAPREYVDLYVDHFGITPQEYAILGEYEGDVLAIPLGVVRELDEATKGKLDQLLYYAAVRAMDDAIADIYEELVATGVANDTLFMFASDNGARLPLGESGPLRDGKGSEYEGGHRVPNFIIWPEEIEAGEIIDENIWVGDLYPTFLSIAGIDYGEGLDGVDVSPALRGEASFDRGIIIPHTKVTARTIVFTALEGDIKYVRRASVSRDSDGPSISEVTEEIYDLSVDIGETQNVVTDARYGANLAAFRAAYENFGEGGLRGDDYFLSRDLTRENNPLDAPEEWGSTWSSDDPRIIKYGTGSSDTMIGEPDADTFLGAAGDDIIDAGDGNDVLNGGKGADDLVGGGGVDAASFAGAISGVTADLREGVGTRGDAEGDTYSLIENLLGSDFNDRLIGNIDRNALMGGRGADNISGLAGTDILRGDDGNDLVSGGNGDDMLNGGRGDDLLFGNGGIDSISGGIGTDTIFSGTGDDSISGRGWDDSIYGQGGADLIEGDGGLDIIYGGPGSDTIDGGAHDDMLFGNGNDDTIDGGGGNDVIQGAAGLDVLMGDSGDDFLTGGIGGDRLDGGTGDDVMHGGGTDGARDTFVFKVGYGKDRINAFDQAGMDQLELDDALWLDTNPGGLTAQQVVDTFGALNPAGFIITLDFGNGDVLEVQNASGIDAGTLGEDIVFV